MPDGSLGRNGNSENRNAIWKTYNWRKILEAEKWVSGLLPMEAVSPQYVFIVVLQHKGEWVSFLSELMPLIEPYCSV